MWQSGDRRITGTCSVNLGRNYLDILSMSLLPITVLGSAFCWWPMLVDPRLELPFWLFCALPAAYSGLASALERARWLLYPLASTIGTFVGVTIGHMIWWPRDPIAGPWIPYVIVLCTAITLVGSFLVSLVMRVFQLSRFPSRKALWAAFIGIVAFGPVTLALTPPLVQYRIAKNDAIAAKRFAALKKAVERTYAGPRGVDRICEGPAIRANYDGPDFSAEDWRRIVGNIVSQEGYGYMVYCREKHGYLVTAGPSPEPGYGSRQYCADESGVQSCDVDWDGSHKRCRPADDRCQVNLLRSAWYVKTSLLAIAAILALVIYSFRTTLA